MLWNFYIFIFLFNAHGAFYKFFPLSKGTVMKDETRKHHIFQILSVRRRDLKEANCKCEYKLFQATALMAVDRWDP